MIKSHLLFLIAIVSGFLLTLQFLTLQVLVRKASVEVHPAWEILNAVTSTAFKNDVPLFLVDAEILGFVSNGTTPADGNSYCKLFCAGHKLTHLGTFGQFVTTLHLSKFVQSLRDHGYTVLEHSDFDPTLLHHNLKVTIPLHLIVLNEKSERQQSHVVHIVIFHERVSRYWWHGPLDLDEYDQRLLYRQGIKKSQFKMSHSSAIYDKVEILPTTIDRLTISLPNPVENFMQPFEAVQFIECDKVQAKRLFESHPQPEDDKEANHFRGKALSLLTKATQLLNELSVPFWLSSGTCLGYFRQCDFITYGNDVDIGIWIEDFRPELISTFSTHDLPLIHSFGKIEDSFELSFVHGDIKLDVFFFYKESDHVWNGGTQARTRLKFKYRFPKFTLCWTEFMELKLRVPCETLSYVEANYGKNWSTPVESWDWKASPPNVQPNGQWPVSDKDAIQLFPILDIRH